MSVISRIVRYWTQPTTKTVFDRQLVWLVLLLMLLGLVMVGSASFSASLALDKAPLHYLFRHAVFLAIALVAFFAVLSVPLAHWMRYSSYLLGISFLLLILVLVMGKSVNGASRWLPLGFFNVQPAEIAKLTLFVFMASYLARKHDAIRQTFYDGYVKPFILFGGLSFLLLSQPDFGSMVVMLVVLFGMLFIAGARLFPFLALLTAGVLSVAALILTASYRLRRVTSFLDPWEDPYGGGYQLTQSLMAFGRGEWFGQGLGNSIQKLEYLPEAHTDFVFAIMGEELGFIGVCIVLVLIFSLVFKALFIGRKALLNEQRFGGYLAVAIGIWFAFQTLVNVGATAGLAPTKGLTLPLISYGGSSLLVMSLACALLLRIDYECQQMRRPNKE